MVLGHDVPAVGLGQGLEHAGLGHQGPGVDELLQYAGVWLLGQREVQDGQLVRRGQPRPRLGLARHCAREYPETNHGYT